MNIEYIEKIPLASEYNSLIKKVEWGEREENIVENIFIYSRYYGCT